jgi:hypothetical protein
MKTKRLSLMFVPYGSEPAELISTSDSLDVLKAQASGHNSLRWEIHPAIPHGKLAIGVKGSYIIDPDVRATDYIRVPRQGSKEAYDLDDAGEVPSL